MPAQTSPIVAHKPKPVTDSMASRLPEKVMRWEIALLILIPLLAFGRVCVHEFTWWDDSWMIHANPDLNPPTLRGTLWYWGHSHGGMYSPVTYTVWSVLAAVSYSPEVDRYGFHIDPWLYHATNLLFHIGTVLIVYRILQLLVGRAGPAALGALLYAVHPLQAEPVAWAVSLKEILCAFFGFLSLWQYLLFAKDAPTPARPPTIRAPRRRQILSLIGLVLAMFSNPLAAGIPLIAALLDRFILGRPWRKVLFSITPLLIAAVAIGVLAKFNQPDLGRVPPLPLTRIPLAADAVAFYLCKLILPIRLAADYGRRPAVVIAHGWIYWTWIVPTAAGVAVWWFGRARRWLPATALIFVAGLLPVLGLIPFEYQKFSTVADRYACIALFGPALALTFVLAGLKPSRRAIVYSIIALWITLLGCQSAWQCGYWRDDAALWKHAIAVAPDSYLAHQDLASAYWRAGPAFDTLAEPEFRKAIQLKPDFSDAHDGLALVLLRQGRAHDAIPEMERSMELLEATGWKLRPDAAEPYFMLGKFLIRDGDYVQAERFLRKALDLQPNFPGGVEALDEAARNAAQIRGVRSPAMRAEP